MLGQVPLVDMEVSLAINTYFGITTEISFSDLEAEHDKGLSTAYRKSKVGRR